MMSKNLERDDDLDISLGLESVLEGRVSERRETFIAKSTENRESLECVNHHRTKLKKSLAILIPKFTPSLQGLGTRNRLFCIL